MPRGRFIVLEGPDKSGKSTQALKLSLALQLKGFKVIHTREPGGTSLSEEIRRMLLRPTNKVCPIAELLLYEAARAEHVQRVIRPAVAGGCIVISERFTLASLVYQGHARRLGLPLVRQLNKVATAGVSPDLTVVLDIPDSAFAERDRGRVLDRLEKESALFRRRVHEGYRTLGRSEPKTRLIDGGRPSEEVHREILKALAKVLPGRPR